MLIRVQSDYTTKRRKKVFLLILAALFLMVVMLLLLKVPAVSRAMDGPDFCGRCHVMQPEIDTYLCSSHRDVATCDSCHVPDDFLRGGLYRSYTGTKDLLAVMTGRDENICISGMGKNVVQENCLRCHGTVMRKVGNTMRDGGSYCFDCHRSVPHMK